MALDKVTTGVIADDATVPGLQITGLNPLLPK